MIRICNYTKLTDQEIIEKIAHHQLQPHGYALLTAGVTFSFRNTKAGMSIYAYDNTTTVKDIMEMKSEDIVNH